MADDLTLSTLEDGEQLAFMRAVLRHFHEDRDDDALAPFVPMVELDRSYAVRDGDDIVANYGVDTVDLSVPGGALLPCGGVTAVGVAPTHRRRGLLRRMMDRALDDAVDRGEPVAALYASESAIYPRFGFGPSADTWNYRIDLRGLRFREPVDDHLVVPATPDEAASQFPAIYDAARATRGGGVGRTPVLWHGNLVDDHAAWRDGASARRHVHVPGRGYATYRLKRGNDGNLPDGQVQLGELVAVDPEAEQALWQHVTSVDLTTTLVAWPRPVDDAIRSQVVDRLRLRATEGSPLYTRLLDVPRCLASRTSMVADGVTLHVLDPSRDQTGTYRWDTDPSGAACARTDAAAEVTVTIDTLATLWLGATTATALRRAGRLEEHVPGAAARLDALVATDLAPWTPWEF